MESVRRVTVEVRRIRSRQGQDALFGLGQVSEEEMSKSVVVHFISHNTVPVYLMDGSNSFNLSLSF